MSVAASVADRPVAVSIRDLHKSFGRPVLAGATFDIREGETFVVLGQSGTGKSVLLKILVGLLAPDRGDVVVMGEPVWSSAAEDRVRIRRRFGMLFQSAALFDSMNVIENVGFSFYEGGMPEEDIRRRVAEKLAMVRLSGIEEKYPSELSGGMRKRVGLARALASEPPILLYDEPTTGLDPVTSAAINRLIRGVQKRLSVTSIVVTHDMVSAAFIGDRLGLLRDGRMHFIGTPDEFARSTDPIVRQFARGDADGPLSEHWKTEENHEH